MKYIRIHQLEHIVELIAFQCVIIYIMIRPNAEI